MSPHSAIKWWIIVPPYGLSAFTNTFKTVIGSRFNFSHQKTFPDEVDVHLNKFIYFGKCCDKNVKTSFIYHV